MERGWMMRGLGPRAKPDVKPGYPGSQLAIPADPLFRQQEP